MILNLRFGKCPHNTLPKAVDVLLLDLHLSAVPQHTLDHRGDLGGRAAFQLRVDAGRFLLDVPVDHDPRPTIANMPLGHQILIPGAEFLGIGGTGCRPFSPDIRTSDREGGIDDLGNRGPQSRLVDEAPADIEQLAIAERRVPCEHPLQARIGPEPI